MQRRRRHNNKGEGGLPPPAQSEGHAKGGDDEAKLSSKLPPKAVLDALPEAKTRPREGQRTGFMAGEIDVPADFDTMGGEDIGKQFEGGS